MSDQAPSYGVLGGVFDPVHYGHLFIAQAVADRLGLARVLLVPAARPPHRAAQPVAGAEQRAHMVRLATEGNDTLMLDASELERPGPSYTVDTVVDMVRAHGSPPVLILGSDAFLEIRSWHRWRELIRLAPLALAARPGADTRAAEELARDIGAHVVCLEDSMGLDISSTALRRRLAAGLSVRYLTPDPVLAHIRQAGLYTADERSAEKTC